MVATVVGKKSLNGEPTSKVRLAAASWASGKAGTGMGGGIIYREAGVWVNHRRHYHR